MKNFLLLFLFLCFGSATAQWKKHESIPSLSNVPSIFVEGQYVYAGADSVIYISADYGKTFFASSRIGKDVDFVSAVVKYQNKVFAGTYHYGIFVSSNNGLTWTEINNGLIGLGATDISDVVIRGDSIYAATYGAGIFVMDLTNPLQWNNYGDGLSYNNSYNVYDLKLIDDVLYAGAGGNGYFYRNDGKSSFWNEIVFGAFQGEPLIMYDILKFNSEFFIASSYGLHKSKDGINWSYINPGVGYVSGSNFAVHNQKIYIHFSKGYGRTIWFTSSNGGESWDFLEDQIGAEVLNIAVVDNKLFAGRLYGMWSLDLNATSVNDGVNISQNFQLMQNYPNPFNPETTINYLVPAVARVTLKVFDVLGKEVATLVDEYKQPGSYNFRLSANNFHLSSGVYFYTLSCLGFSNTKKFMLLK
ncbi:MAG: T9SS type A sorting domain-containing protein [Ignavibacteriales bacterium]|nr:T9SS type A sorting domain-containing protein [Ignavibacteriales bacterium]